MCFIAKIDYHNLHKRWKIEVNYKKKKKKKEKRDDYKQRLKILKNYMRNKSQDN